PDRQPTIPPVGFGPLPPSWPERADKLPRSAPGWTMDALREDPLPEDFDAAYFNVAPRDQQLDELLDSERIVLENLHPEPPRLPTRLPGLHPLAFMDRPGRAAERIAMRADLLWIDTDWRRCTLTWRGQVLLDSPDQPGRVLVAMERGG